MKKQEFSSVWDALEDTPQESENMKIRSNLMVEISQHLEKLSGTQSEKAKAIGITQPRLNDLLQGRINKFSLDALVSIAFNAGLKVSIHTDAA